MKRTVTITARAEARYEGGGPERTSFRVPGTLEETARGITLAYDEPAALGMGTVTTTLEFSGSAAALTRMGAVRCAFRFAEGERHDSVYETAFGSFPAEVETRALRTKLDGHGGIVEIRYALTLGGAPGEHRLKLLIRTEGSEA